MTVEEWPALQVIFREASQLQRCPAARYMGLGIGRPFTNVAIGLNSNFVRTTPVLTGILEIEWTEIEVFGQCTCRVAFLLKL